MWFRLGLILLFTVRTQSEQLLPMPSENLTFRLLETRHGSLNPRPPSFNKVPEHARYSSLTVIPSTLSETETEVRSQSIITLQSEPYISISNELVTSLGAVKAWVLHIEKKNIKVVHKRSVPSKKYDASLKFTSPVCMKIINDQLSAPSAHRNQLKPRAASCDCLIAKILREEQQTNAQSGGILFSGQNVNSDSTSQFEVMGPSSMSPNPPSSRSRHPLDGLTQNQPKMFVDYIVSDNFISPEPYSQFGSKPLEVGGESIFEETNLPSPVSIPQIQSIPERIKEIEQFHSKAIIYETIQSDAQATSDLNCTRSDTQPLQVLLIISKNSPINFLLSVESKQSCSCDEELEQLVPVPSENLTSQLLETRHESLSPNPPNISKVPKHAQHLTVVPSTLSETETDVRSKFIITLQPEPYISNSNKLVSSLGAVKAWVLHIEEKNIKVIHKHSTPSKKHDASLKSTSLVCIKIINDQLSALSAYRNQLKSRVASCDCLIAKILREEQQTNAQSGGILFSGQNVCIKIINDQLSARSAYRNQLKPRAASCDCLITKILLEEQQPIAQSRGILFSDQTVNSDSSSQFEVMGPSSMSPNPSSSRSPCPLDENQPKMFVDYIVNDNLISPEPYSRFGSKPLDARGECIFEETNLPSPESIPQIQSIPERIKEIEQLHSKAINYETIQSDTQATSDLNWISLHHTPIQDLKRKFEEADHQESQLPEQHTSLKRRQSLQTIDTPKAVTHIIVEPR